MKTALSECPIRREDYSLGMISKKTVKRWYYVAVIVGLMIAAALIIILNQQIMIAACAEHGGRYIAEQSLCIDSVTIKRIYVYI